MRSLAICFRTVNVPCLLSYSIPVLFLINDKLSLTSNTISHEYEAQIVNRKPAPSYRMFQTGWVNSTQSVGDVNESISHYYRSANDSRIRYE
jgi:hypothetical protein